MTASAPVFLNPLLTDHKLQMKSYSLLPLLDIVAAQINILYFTETARQQRE
jgi:hypothetical protein